MPSEHKLIPRVGVGVIVIHQGKLLLGKRRNSHGEGQWACPGGHLEFGEEVDACARRELAEETGLNALSMRMGGWVNNIIDEKKHYVTLFVFVDRCEGELQLLEPEKCQGWEWWDIKALPKPLFSTLHSFLEKVTIESLLS